ncbi:hypothetical protein KGF54_003876 [Candida jiufengensis]|uniref:uncharacterized protein n=1 Tax=Candida jiufengensis TaxID=497108 RepID=UPI0022254E30|nr:uncharacterized protein KGF54_003876 [Candida jiufengensis]KAI5950802.1 hypothetical protein KGF54_003876 [Candida jiufengensis]
MFQQQQQQQGFNQQNSFHTYNGPIDNNPRFFNPDVPQEICPNIWLGPYSSLINQTSPNSSFISNSNVKVIINCGSTLNFLDLVENSPKVSISSDIMILSLDPSFTIIENNELINNFILKFNKILQNYINSFYINSSITNLIHKLPNSTQFQINSPILNGSNIKIQFFKIIRLISIFKLINQSLQILIVSEDGNLNLSTGLIIAYLMDNYKFNFQNSFKFLKTKRPSIKELRLSYYDDLLIIENLKKFYLENVDIKQNCSSQFINKCKRNCDDFEDDESYCGNGGGVGGDDMMRDEIIVGGREFRKRKFH